MIDSLHPPKPDDFYRGLFLPQTNPETGIKMSAFDYIFLNYVHKIEYFQSKNFYIQRETSYVCGQLINMVLK